MEATPLRCSLARNAHGTRAHDSMVVLGRRAAHDNGELAIGALRNAPPLDPSAPAAFKEALQKANIQPEHVLPHGSYLVNLGSPSTETRDKSRQVLLAELRRCQELGITKFNIHPGSTKGEITQEDCIKAIAEGVNWALGQTAGVSVVFENTAGGGGTIGRSFEELKQLIDLVEDKTRCVRDAIDRTSTRARAVLNIVPIVERSVGICLDTCHLFASGYDLRTPETFEHTMAEFERIVGFKWLQGVHLNDSKVRCH